MILANQAITYARKYGYNLQDAINEITLRESMPTDYQDNARQIANRKRKLKRNLERCVFSLLSSLKPNF